MTNQEAFDIMVKHLRKQGSRCTNGSRCVYRGPNGMKCAVGALIPDGEYHANMDLGLSKCAATIVQIFSPPSLDGLDLDMLDRMQDVHDSWPPNEWETQFRDLAGEFCLTVPPMETSA